MPLTYLDELVQGGWNVGGAPQDPHWHWGAGRGSERGVQLKTQVPGVGKGGAFHEDEGERWLQDGHALTSANQGLRSLRVRHNKPRLALLTSQAQQMVVPPVNAVLNMFMAQRLILAFLFIACKSKSAYLDI